MTFARLVTAFTLTAAITMNAGAATFVIPDQGWKISFDSPELQKKKENNGSRQYSYLGNAGRMTVSLFVEDPGCNGGTRHEDYYQCFWPMSSRNPLIAKDTVKRTCV